MKILLVDDARSVVMVMTSRLGSYGHEVVCASNGQAAVETFAIAAPDLVLMDIEMPVMNGFEATNQIRAFEAKQQWAWTPIIFLTSSDTVENLVTAIEAGGDDFMSKLVPEPVLQAKMKAMSRIAVLRRSLSMANQGLETLVGQYRAAQLELEEARARELDIGSQIQRTLLFGSVPAHFGLLAVAAHSEASKGIDGDFYEFLSYSIDHCDLSIGDVMGKGIPAALIGAAVKRQLSQVMAEEMAHGVSDAGLPEPDQLINALHRLVTPQLVALESFVTLAYLRIDVARGLITLVNAGHTPVLLAGKRGIRWLKGDNLPLGVMADELYLQKQFEVHAGELLFIYSDGFTEAFSPQGQEFGGERLGQRVSELQAANIPVAILVQAVRKSIHDFEQRNVPSDDRTCIAVRCNRSATEVPTELELPWHLGALGALREVVGDRARLAGLSKESRDALILAAYEVATNVVRHANPALVDATLLLRVEETTTSLEVSLYYVGAPYTPVSRKPDFSGHSEGGFGNYIIENCVDVVAYDSPAEGVVRTRLSKHKTVTANEAAVSFPGKNSNDKLGSW